MSESPPARPLPITADVHMHTCHSHGQASTRDMYLSAAANGLSIIGFSEHSPRPPGYNYPTDYQEKLVAEFPQYVREVLDLADEAEHSGRTVLLGLEVDYIPDREDYACQLCTEYHYDYIIGGLHFQGPWGFDFRAEDWEAMAVPERDAAYERYYRNLAAMCRTGLFHIAAHPDLIKIFSKESFDAWLELPDSLTSVATALAAMKEHGVIMEVSSAGLRKPCAEIYPGPRIMALAARLGLPISFASDAHCINTPAHAFPELARYAASFGYTESFIVQRGRPRALPFTSPGPFS